MAQQTLFKIRDKRKRGWFWLDNEYFNGFAKIFGPTGTAIYLSLCRHADNEEQKCFPSEKTIAEELDTTDRTVRKYLKWFLKYKFIDITKERTIKGSWLNNTYWLLDKTEWSRPEEIISDGLVQRKRKSRPEENKDKPIGSPVPLNYTHKNYTHKKETNIATPAVVAERKDQVIFDLIELFKSVNPSYERLFANKSQRAALERMLKKHGQEKIDWAIRMIEKTNQMPFSPTITTPIALEQKLGDLIVFCQKEKIKADQNGMAIIKTK